MSEDKPIIVGLYGIPGSGKTYLLNQLKQELEEKYFAFFEGSQMIASIVPGGLDAFQKMEEQEKIKSRRLAIAAILKDCTDSGKVGIVTGHFMFWSEGEEAGSPVHTQSDLDIFSHIVYLDVIAEVVNQRRREDVERTRPSVSANHLNLWQREEQLQLRSLCLENNILFSLISAHPSPLAKVCMLLQDFRRHNERYNQSYAESKLDEVVMAGKGLWKTMMILDGDRTVAAEDTGAIFWEKVSSSRPLRDKDFDLKTLFSSPLGYSYNAFRQATLLYEETANDEEFEVFCQDTASMVTLHPEVLSLLRLVAEQEHVGIVMLTCGLRRVWEMVLEREGLAKNVRVIGGGRITDGLVVSSAIKTALVSRLQRNHCMYVWAFGDSPLDLECLMKADQAVVVVGEKDTRSKTMDTALTNAIENDGLRARQALLPINASPRLDTNKLPIVSLTEPEFVKSILCDQNTRGTVAVHYATNKNAAKLLATPMRDATVAGPDLREAHRRVGWYLGVEFLADVIGLDQYRVQHVQGHHTMAHQLFHERQTTIVALMRGGEPMAYGINDVFPLAMFLHASNADDVKMHHLQGQLTLVLVDSVINTGKTIIEFVQHVRKLHATIRIVVVAGVVQAQCISGGNLVQALARHDRIHLIALRQSHTKFKGSGNTDTGNRLFNTTHLK